MNWNLRYSAWKTKFNVFNYAVPFELPDDTKPGRQNPRGLSIMRWRFHEPVRKWDQPDLTPIQSIQTWVQNNEENGVLRSMIYPLNPTTGLLDLNDDPAHDAVCDNCDLHLKHNHNDHLRAHTEALRNFIHHYRGLLDEPTERTDWEE